MVKEDKFVIVWWNDSKVTQDWRPDTCTEDDVARCRTVGILKAEDKTKMTIALSDSYNGSVMATSTIQRGCITKIKEWRAK